MASPRLASIRPAVGVPALAHERNRIGASSSAIESDAPRIVREEGACAASRRLSESSWPGKCCHHRPAPDLNGPVEAVMNLSLIHISEPTRLLSISYAVFCL